jgi:hypothetical protein
LADGFQTFVLPVSPHTEICYPITGQVTAIRLSDSAGEVRVASTEIEFDSSPFDQKSEVLLLKEDVHMEERVRELERRLALAEETIARLSSTLSNIDATNGITLTAPLRIVDAEGQVVLELSADMDGGLILVNSLDGKIRASLGCDPHGGFMDIIHAGSERLAITLTATPDGGNIEVTDKDGNYVFDAREQAIN